MEFIAELIMEFILGIFFELPMESEHVKTWVKTTLFLILCGVLDALGIFLFYQTCFVQHDLIGSLVCGGILLFLLCVMIFGAINGHKNDWKQDI